MYQSLWNKPSLSNHPVKCVQRLPPMARSPSSCQRTLAAKETMLRSTLTNYQAAKSMVMKVALVSYSWDQRSVPTGPSRLRLLVQQTKVSDPELLSIVTLMQLDLHRLIQNVILDEATTPSCQSETLSVQTPAFSSPDWTHLASLAQELVITTKESVPTETSHQR